MKHTSKILALLLLITVYSCNQKQEVSDIEGYALMEGPVKTNKTTPERESGDNVAVERKIIKEGDIHFETADAKETRKIISKSVIDLKGYISKDNVYDYKDKVEHTITIRVPAGNFELLLDRISKNAKKIDSKNINALDVTEEFIDVEARIKTKKELENRYKELLVKANTVDEILNIEREIGSLRSDIESIEGRLKYLNDKISFSTLTVVFYEKTSSDFGFNSKMGQAVQGGWSNLLWFFIAFTNLWPFLLISLSFLFIYRSYKKRNKKK